MSLVSCRTISVASFLLAKTVLMCFPAEKTRLFRQFSCKYLPLWTFTLASGAHVLPFSQSLRTIIEGKKSAQCKTIYTVFYSYLLSIIVM